MTYDEATKRMEEVNSEIRGLKAVIAEKSKTREQIKAIVTKRGFESVEDAKKHYEEVRDTTRQTIAETEEKLTIVLEKLENYLSDHQ